MKINEVARNKNNSKSSAARCQLMKQVKHVPLQFDFFIEFFFCCFFCIYT